jgi:hypothetical protein
MLSRRVVAQYFKVDRPANRTTNYRRNATTLPAFGVAQ